MHICPDNKVYIGCTSLELKVRFGYMGEGYMVTRNSTGNIQPFGLAIQKIGWENIEHVVLATTEDREEASRLEQYYINLYDATNPEKGYNRYKGGLGAPMGPISEEICAKITKGKTGAVGIHKDGKNKYVRPEEVPGYLQDGWLRGGEPLPEAQRQHLKDMYKGTRPSDKMFAKCKEAVTGSILMHKGDVNKRVRPEEYETYLADGWIKGMSEEWARIHRESHKGRKQTAEERAKKSEALKGKNIGKKFINKNGVVKSVSPAELASYLADGWSLGLRVSNTSTAATQSKYKQCTIDIHKPEVGEQS